LELDRKSLNVLGIGEYELQLQSLLIQRKHVEMKLNCTKPEVGQTKPLLKVEPRTKAAVREISRDESSITFDMYPLDSGYVWIKVFDGSNAVLDSSEARILFYPSPPFSKKWPLLTSGATAVAGIMAVVFRSQENDLEDELNDMKSDPDFSDKYYDPEDRSFRDKYDDTNDEYISKGNVKDALYVATGVLAVGSAYLWGKYYFSYYRPSRELKKEYLEKYGVQVSCAPFRVMLAYRF
jgi:hypothetical protein